MQFAKIRYSDQSRWQDAHRVQVASACGADAIAKQTMSLFQLNWADVQFDGGEIRTIYASEIAKKNREMANAHGVRDSVQDTRNWGE